MTSNSAVSLDNGVRDYFENSEDEIHYHGLPLAPLLFQDDVLRLSLGITSAQAGNTKMEDVAESKLLNFNLEKSCYSVIGRERRRLEIMKELSHKPLQLCGKAMVHATSVKYHGDIISENELSDSVNLTVNSRKGLVTKAIYEIRCIVDDCRSHIVGGLVAGMNIWEMSVLPMLLYNSETWQEISRTTLKTLENLQIRFLRSLFSVGTGCPIPLLYSESGMLLMEFRILEKKLMFLHHLYHLEESSLAKEVVHIQTSNGLPGIVEECNELLVKLGTSNIKDLNKLKVIQQVNNRKYKKIDYENFLVTPLIVNLTLII